MKYYIQSKETGIVHLVSGTVGQAGVQWTLCNQVAVASEIRSDLPTGYRICHHCQVVSERQAEMARE